MKADSQAQPQPTKNADPSRWIDPILVWMSAAILPIYLTGSRLQSFVILRPADVLSLATLALTLIFVRGSSRAFTRPAVLMLFALVIYVVIQGIYLNVGGLAIKEATQLLFIILVVVCTGVQIERHPAQFLRAFSILLGCTLVYTLAYHFSLGEYYRYKSSNEGRYTFGIFSVLMLLAASKRQWKGWWLALFLLSIPPLIASLERKGPTGVVIVLLFLGLLYLRDRYRLDPKIALLFILLSLTAGLIAFAGDIYDKFQYALMDNYYVDEAAALWESNVHRKALLINGFDIFINHWPFGTGADTLRMQMRNYFIDPRLGNSTHNFYLDNLIKYGAVGGGWFFAAIFVGIIATIRKAAQKLQPALWCAYFLLVIGFISDGAAVTYMAIFPIVCGRLFETDELKPVATREAISARQRLHLTETHGFHA